MAELDWPCMPNQTHHSASIMCKICVCRRPIYFERMKFQLDNIFGKPYGSRFEVDKTSHQLMLVTNDFCVESKDLPISHQHSCIGPLPSLILADIEHNYNVCWSW